MIGLFGGAFDPVHQAHIKTVLHVLNTCHLQQIRLIPLNLAVHKKQPQFNAKQRLSMLNAATSPYPQLIVDDRELKRQGDSYTIDTLYSLKQDYPDETFCLILGSDAFNHFLSWQQPNQILNLVHLLIMKRPENALSNDSQLQQLLKKHQTSVFEELRKKPSGKIFFQDVPQIRLSSTTIRNKMARNESIDHLVPHSILPIIKTKH